MVTKLYNWKERFASGRSFCESTSHFTQTRSLLTTTKLSESLEDSESQTAESRHMNDRDWGTRLSGGWNEVHCPWVRRCAWDRVRGARRALSERTHGLWHGAAVPQLCVGAERVFTQVWGQFSVEPKLQLFSWSNMTETNTWVSAHFRKAFVARLNSSRNSYLSFHSIGSLDSEILLWLLHWPGTPFHRNCSAATAYFLVPIAVWAARAKHRTCKRLGFACSFISVYQQWANIRTGYSCQWKSTKDKEQLWNSPQR